jgi:uncharacterized OsmC-like protein
MAQKISLTAKCVGPTILAAEVRGHQIVADLPEAMGGTNIAPMPPELLLASVAECYGMVVIVHCRDRGINYEGMTVSASAEKAVDENGEEYWHQFKVHLHMPEELPKKRMDALLRHAKQTCSVRGTVLRAVDVVVTAGAGATCAECQCEMPGSG